MHNGKGIFFSKCSHIYEFHILQIYLLFLRPDINTIYLGSYIYLSRYTYIISLFILAFFFKCKVTKVKTYSAIKSTQVHPKTRVNWEWNYVFILGISFLVCNFPKILVPQEHFILLKINFCKILPFSEISIYIAITQKRNYTLDNIFKGMNRRLHTVK